MTIWKIAEEMNMNSGNVRLIWTKDLNMKKVCAKMVQKASVETKKIKEMRYAQTFQQDYWKNLTFWEK
jgi:hypothetical protein